MANSHLASSEWAARYQSALDELTAAAEEWASFKTAAGPSLKRLLAAAHQYAQADDITLEK